MFTIGAVRHRKREVNAVKRTFKKKASLYKRNPGYYYGITEENRQSLIDLADKIYRDVLSAGIDKSTLTNKDVIAVASKVKELAQDTGDAPRTEEDEHDDKIADMHEEQLQQLDKE